MFIINSILQPLNDNTAPKQITMIGFITNFYTPDTKYSYPASQVDQCIQSQFQPSITVHQRITKKSTADTPLLAQHYGDLSKMIPVLRNLYTKEDTLIYLKNFYDDINLSFTSSIHKSLPFLLEFHRVDSYKSLINLLDPSTGEHFHEKYRQPTSSYIEHLTRSFQKTSQSLLHPWSTISFNTSSRKMASRKSRIWRVPAQDRLFALILWYVAKTIYLL